MFKNKKFQEIPKKTNNDIRINLKDSAVSLPSSFSDEEIPEEDELEDFEEKSENEARDEEIDQGLTEIYQDDSGHLVDVHSLEKIRRKGFLLSLANFLFFILVVCGLAYYVYDHWYKNATPDNSAIIFTLSGNKDVVVGEEFSYEIKYKNEARTALHNVKVNVTFPDNFVLESLEPGNSDAYKGFWDIGQMNAYSEGIIKIKGEMMGTVDQSGILSAYLSYSPEGLSSEYRKEAYASTKIIDTGVGIKLDFYDTALVGEMNEVLIRFSAMDKNFLNEFRMSLEPQENLTIQDYIPKDTKAAGYENFAPYKIDRSGIWEVSDILDVEKIIPVRFKINDKKTDKQDLVFKFEKKANNDKYYEFFRKTITFNVMKNNLNLTTIINGERSDMGVDFGETLNYSIVYNNKGDATMKDVVIMAVLDGDNLDWTTLQDKNNGREKGNTITWSKEEIPDLAEIKQDSEGNIDFSIKVLEFGAIDLNKKHEIISYARFSVGKESEEKEDDKLDNKSNTIIGKINSDLKFSEKILYFNEDNIPVGSGPNPPKVDERTSYKVYWKINNNLHELSKLGVTVKLPDYIEYDARDRATVGSLIYSAETHELTWNVGRLPTTVYEASAEFSIAITPSIDDQNKIIVLLPGSNVQAIDSETEENLSVSSKAKTTKLEDDEIGTNDGMVD